MDAVTFKFMFDPFEDLKRDIFKKQIPEQAEREQWYNTAYREANSGNTYESGLYALNYEHARTIARCRNLGEEVTYRVNTRPWELPSKIFERWFSIFEKYSDHVSFPRKEAERQHSDFVKLNCDLMHGTVWIGYLALKSKVASVDEILADRGIIHMATHVTTGILDAAVPYARPEAISLGKMLPKIENRIPGLVHSLGEN